MLEVGRPPVQQDVGLAADDARRRARRIQEDRVERRAIPPGVEVAPVGGVQRRPIQLQPPERRRDLPQPPGINVERDQPERGRAFEQVDPGLGEIQPHHALIGTGALLAQQTGALEAVHHV